MYQKIEAIDPNNLTLLNYLKNSENFVNIINKFYEIAHKAEETNKLLRNKREQGIPIEIRDFILLHYIVNDFVFFFITRL